MKIDNLTAYEPMTDAILEWCADGWISSNEFDRRVDEYEARPPAGKVRVAGFKPSDYVLPSVVGNQSPRGDWIFLVQTIVDKGYIERRKVNGAIQYRALAKEMGLG